MAYLFSYGTLQQVDVQLSTFGRILKGIPDCLVGYVIAQLSIESNDEMATSGRNSYPIAKATGSRSNRVPGVVFDVTQAELMYADHYEGDDYKREQLILESGKTAWVYVDARSTNGGINTGTVVTTGIRPETGTG